MYNNGMNKKDEQYMKMCLSLAKKGYGKVQPNPMVGCVIVDKNGQIISKGKIQEQIMSK